MKHLWQLIALRHLKLSPVRSLLTLFGIGFAVSAVIAISAANNAVLESFRSTVDHISGKVDLEVGDGDVPLDAAVLDKLGNVAGITHVSPVVQARIREAKTHENLFLLGVDLTGDDYFRDYTTDDGGFDPIEFLNCIDCVMLSERFAALHGVKRGDVISVRAPSGLRTLKVKELLKDEGAAKAFGGNFAVMYLDAAQILLDREERYDRIDIAFDKQRSHADIEAAIAQAIGTGVPVETPGRRGERTEKMLDRFRVALQLGSMVSLMVSMFMIYNTIGIAVAQRRREIGMLRALGVTQREAQLLFVGEATALGILGSVLGVFLGTGIAHGVLRFVSSTVSILYVQVQTENATITPMTIAIGIASGVIVTALSAFLPAREAAQTAPASSMHRASGSGAPPSFSWKNGLFASAIFFLFAGIFAVLPPIQGQPVFGQLAMFCCLIATSALSPLMLIAVARGARRPMSALLGTPGRVAADNLSRLGNRAVVTVSALLVGVGMAVGTSTFINGFQVSIHDWLVQSVPADLFITSSAKLAAQGNTRLPGELITELEAIPGGKDRIERIGVRKMNFRDLRIAVVVVEAAQRLAHATIIVQEGEPLKRVEDLTAERTVLVSENLAARRGIHAGETITLESPTGAHDYKVRGIYVDYTSDQGVLLMDRSWYVKDFLDDSVDTFELYQPDETLRENFKRTVLATLGEKYDLFVLTNHEFRSEIEGVVEQSFAATSALSIIAILIALLGVVNTLFAAIIDRTREIGVLRAIGMTRREVALTLIGEAGLLALCAAVLGVWAGWQLGVLFVEVVNRQYSGWHIGLHTPWGYAFELGVLAVIASALAALWPALRAARLTVVEALSYE